MTAPERLNARPSAFHPSRRRAPACNAEVRSNSDYNRHNARLKLQNGAAFNQVVGGRAPRTLAPPPCGNPQTICRPVKSHR
jgi:hypothetical protein